MARWSRTYSFSRVPARRASERYSSPKGKENRAVQGEHEARSGGTGAADRVSVHTMSDEHYAWVGRRVLVTGASGFVGQWLVKHLIGRGAEAFVHTRDRSSAAGDITDRPLLQRMLTEHRIEVVFHLAAQSLLPDSVADPTTTFEVNIRGTWTVLEACRRAGVAHLGPVTK